MSKVIILNGPPGVGKDTLANMLVDMYRTWGEKAVRLEFKDSLIRIAKAITGVTDSEWDRLYRRDQKERKQTVYGNLSARELLIKISEEWVKPQFGYDHFGQLALADINRHGEATAFFSDGGFLDELIPAAQHHEVIVARLFREGYDYGNDSRTYIDPIQAGHHGIKVYDYHLTAGEPGATVHAIRMDVDDKYRKRMNMLR
ncbi:deoxynucleotide monophosphate kinase [Serratia phage vB_SmaP-Kaonashi]|nr:deoxynucleotide monophosphate kinase [Serratia phage vB_SmaP-Kaonashi]